MSLPEIKSEVRTPKNVEELTTQNAHYRIIRSWHTVGNSQEEIGDAKVLCLESVLDSYDFPFLDYVFKKHVALDIQFKNIVNLPQLDEIYITDTFATKSFSQLLRAERSMKNLGLLFGGNAAAAGMAAMLLSRRVILKGMGAGAVSIGTYFAAPAVMEELVAQGFKDPILNEAQKHYQKFLIHFRNLIIAHKSEFIAERIKLRTNTSAKIAIAIGGAHGLLPIALKTDKKERERLITDLLKDLGQRIPSEELRLIEQHIYLVPVWNKRTDTVEMLDMRTGSLSGGK